MTHKEQHQCDTCNLSPFGEEDNCSPSNCPLNWNPSIVKMFHSCIRVVDRINLKINLMSVVDAIGCASHSSTTSPVEQADRVGLCNHFMRAESRVISYGYADEIEWVKNIPPFEKCTEKHFFEQYIWCVLNLGVREQTMREEYNKFIETLDINTIHNRFKKKKREAARAGIDNFVRWFGELKCAKDPIKYLQSLPLIGKTTKYHLARNIGIDVPKTDLHMKRLMAFYNYDSAMAICKEIQQIAPDLKIGVIDLILWRDCNLRGKP